MSHGRRPRSYAAAHGEKSLGRPFGRQLIRQLRDARSARLSNAIGSQTRVKVES